MARTTTSEPQTDFGRWLRETRVAKGWTILRLAEEIGSNGPVVSNLESGNRKPSYKMVMRLTTALSVPADPAIRAAFPTNGTESSINEAERIPDDAMELYASYKNAPDFKRLAIDSLLGREPRPFPEQLDEDKSY